MKTSTPCDPFSRGRNGTHEREQVPAAEELGARVLEYRYKGMRTVFLENEKLRVGVLADKGTDVFEFNDKPRDVDFVWLTACGVRNPTNGLQVAVENGTALSIEGRERLRFSLQVEVTEQS